MSHLPFEYQVYLKRKNKKDFSINSKIVQGTLVQENNKAKLYRLEALSEFLASLTGNRIGEILELFPDFNRLYGDTGDIYLIYRL